MWYFILVAQANNMDDIWQKKKNQPAMQDTQVRYLDWEDPLENGMTTHSSTLFSFNFIFSIYFTLQYCIGLPYINMNPPWVYS